MNFILKHKREKRKITLKMLNIYTKDHFKSSFEFQGSGFSSGYILNYIKLISKAEK